ncbi:hypothetical protein QAD02_009941 [Eretmocerus hayati]|uniref:Uncharacterized protein n=1 Tax=Eretmocerus hayati TaxID=131215 RepID=A0ACC2NBF6_9HYME|nr:hypothetical protein QAD02_009941 [Eretmocerus hayati]
MPWLGKNLSILLIVFLSVEIPQVNHAFRVRDSSTTTDTCQSGKCSPSSSSLPSSWPTIPTTRARRGFEPVSSRGTFVKGPSVELLNHEIGEDGRILTKSKDLPRVANKLNKVNDVESFGNKNTKSPSSDANEDEDDEIIQIEVEEDEIIARDDSGEDSVEVKRESEKARQAKESEARKKKEEEKRRQEELEDKKRKEDEARKKEEVRRQKEEAERLLREEAELRLKEELEKRLKEEKEAEERRLREEEQRRKKEEEAEKLRQEAERKEREENERKKREEEERKKREEEERKKREEIERKKREEIEKKKREEEEQKKRQEEEKKKQEEEKRKQEEMERRAREVEEKRRRDEEERKRQEEKKKQEEERRRLEEEKKKLEEEKKKLEDEKRKQEEEKKKREEEERKRVEEERRKKEEEDKKRLDEEMKKKREKQETEQRKREEKKKSEEEKRRKDQERKKSEKQRQETEEQKKRERESKEGEKQLELQKTEVKKILGNEDIETVRDKEEDKIRVERLKLEAKERKEREEWEKKKRLKKDGDDGEDAEENEESLPRRGLDSDQSKPTKKPAPVKGSEDEVQNMKSPPSKVISKDSSTNTPKRKENSKTLMNLADFNDMILSMPTFVPNFTAVQDPMCQKHGKIFLRQLRGFKLWALQMLDSSAKIPAGLLRGNVNQLGDFDQCLGVKARVKVEGKAVKVQGKYCLASMDLYAAHSAAKFPINLMQSRGLIRGTMRDPGHFVPKFTTVNWALCLPAACSAKDARRSIENAVNAYNVTAGIKFVIDVDPKMCYVQQTSQSYSKETIGVLYFYAFFICLALIATLRDFVSTPEQKGSYSERIIMAFSFKRTLKALFGSKETSASDIECIHGIRSLSTIALYVAHKLIPTSRIPYANRVSLTELAGNPLSLILRASLFYTDSFLLLSGVLTAYNMARELKSRDEIRWFCRLIARYMRLTPALLAVVFWYAFVMEHTGSGPQWNSVVKANADICKENSWINLLYVQNFFPFEEMCATHTHQLALDMQLSLLAPAVVFFLQIKPILGIIIVFFLLQVSATLRYFATSNNNLSLIIFHGMTVKHLYKTANLTYTLPLHRATPYLFGVCLGVLLHYIGRNAKIHKIFSWIGWSAALASGFWVIFSPWRAARRDYTYNVEDATHYAVISPVLTAFTLCWAIFACFTNSQGVINRLLSSYWMVVFSRLSYSIYLLQFIVFFYNVGSTRYSSEFQIMKAFDPTEAFTVFSASIVLTLLFDIPMQEVKQVIMECSDTLTTATNTTTSSEKVPSEQVNGYQPSNHRGPDNHVNESRIKQPPTREPTYTESEDEPGGWNWNRGTFTRSEPRELDDLERRYSRSSRYYPDSRRHSGRSEIGYDDWLGSNGGGSRRSSRSEDYFGDERNGRMDYGVEEGYLHPRERYFAPGIFATRSPLRDLDAPVYRRSVSRERGMSREREIAAREAYSKRPLITISRDDDYPPPTSAPAPLRSPRSSVPRFTEPSMLQRSLSSESESDLLHPNNSTRRNHHTPTLSPRRDSVEPRIADEDEWEEEIRLHRNRFNYSSPQDLNHTNSDQINLNEDHQPPRRRSSAEGKLALLRERPGNMELWTVSKIQLGSSQEPDDDEYFDRDEEMYLQQRREYREQGPPLREEPEEEEEERLMGSSRLGVHENGVRTSSSLPTSFDEQEEEDEGREKEQQQQRDFGAQLRRITVQDLSKIPNDGDVPADSCWNKLDARAGLFKRESIIRSQASEEEPEYLIPERPKLVEQEQEHPFKKAWQMQKSRSEEEGSNAFTVKELRPSSLTLEKQSEEPEELNGHDKEEPNDTNNETSNNKDVEKDADMNKNNQDEAGDAEKLPEEEEADVTCDVTLVWQARSQDGSIRSMSRNSRSEANSSAASSSSRLEARDNEMIELLDEGNVEQRYGRRRQSDDESWTWTENDT